MNQHRKLPLKQYFKRGWYCVGDNICHFVTFIMSKNVHQMGGEPLRVKSHPPSSDLIG